MNGRRAERAGGGGGLTGQFQVGLTCEQKVSKEITTSSKGELKMTCASEEDPSKGKQPRNLHLCVCQKVREESCMRGSQQEDQMNGRTSTLSSFSLRKATRSHAAREAETEEEDVKEVIHSTKTADYY